VDKFVEEFVDILKAHRLHFYQILANEWQVPHRVVSVVYFAVQLLVSFAIIFLYPVVGWWVFIQLAGVLSTVYLFKFNPRFNRGRFPEVPHYV
jgi:hypothetical protein